jgi:hypothetical protein
MAEFCPRCAAPVDTSGDECRYCDACGWFGDNTETARTPDMAKVYPVWAVVQALALYRTMCRDELQAEQYCERGRTLDGNDSMLASLKRIQREVRNTACVLVGLYIAYGSLDAKPLMVLHRNNDCVPWPTDWTDRHYNGGQRCDTLVGPCSCGAWHMETEDWVRAILLKHNAKIIDGDQP